LGSVAIPAQWLRPDHGTVASPPTTRSKTFHRGSRVYDQQAMGYADEGPYLLDTASPGNSNAGHDFGAGLTAMQKRELIEYLKTL